MLEVLLLYVLICSKNCALPKPLAVERTQECFKSRFFFFFLYSSSFRGQYIVRRYCNVHNGRQGCASVGNRIPKKITVSFTHECPTGCTCKLAVSTCALKLSLPFHYQTKEDMRKAILASIKLSNGFDTIWANIS